MFITSLTFVLMIMAFYISYKKSNSKVYLVEKTRNYTFYQFYNLLGILTDLIYKNKNRLTLSITPGKIAIVTGGTRGIGREVVKTLYAIEVRTIMAVRNVEEGKKVAEMIQKQSVRSALHDIDVMELDTSSMKSVEKFANAIKKKYPEIHLLINNAAVLFADYKLTEDGFESQLATNYIGHFYLTHLLMENLKRGSRDGKRARIVNVSSCVHQAGEIDFEDIHMKRCHEPIMGYCRSKLAQLMSTRYLTKLFETENLPVNCYAVNPGLVATDMFYKTPLFKYNLWMGKILKSPEMGAVSVGYCALSDDLENKGGVYISNCQEATSSAFSKIEDYQKQLHDMTCEMLKIKRFGVVEK